MQHSFFFTSPHSIAKINVQHPLCLQFAILNQDTGPSLFVAATCRTTMHIKKLGNEPYLTLTSTVGKLATEPTRHGAFLGMCQSAFTEVDKPHDMRYLDLC